MKIGHNNPDYKTMPRPDGKEILGASTAPFNALEEMILAELDPDKVNDLAECLFVLNNRRYGPIAGAYMVVCIDPEKKWCVGQLNADRLKPMLLFDDKVYSSPELAREEAERIKLERGESAPCRCT